MRAVQPAALAAGVSRRASGDLGGGGADVARRPSRGPSPGSTDGAGPALAAGAAQRGHRGVEVAGAALLDRDDDEAVEAGRDAAEGLAEHDDLRRADGVGADVLHRGDVGGGDAEGLGVPRRGRRGRRPPGRRRVRWPAVPCRVGVIAPTEPKRFHVTDAGGAAALVGLGDLRPRRPAGRRTGATDALRASRSGRWSCGSPAAGDPCGFGVGRGDGHPCRAGADGDGRGDGCGRDGESPPSSGAGHACSLRGHP